jgi:crotonobetainyl-CoA:carnitine CoA-transferase CaiB-like acyl-CoA transferase
VCEIDAAAYDTLARRFENEDEIESRLGAWTAERTSAEVAELLQARGVEAVPVQNFPEVFRDLQLAAREHFDVHVHPVRGEFHYERNGFRLSDARSGYAGPSPTLGQHTEEILADFLGCTEGEIAALKESGAVE